MHAAAVLWPARRRRVNDHFLNEETWLASRGSQLPFGCVTTSARTFCSVLVHGDGMTQDLLGPTLRCAHHAGSVQLSPPHRTAGRYLRARPMLLAKAAEWQPGRASHADDDTALTGPWVEVQRHVKTKALRNAGGELAAEAADQLDVVRGQRVERAVPDADLVPVGVGLEATAREYVGQRIKPFAAARPACEPYRRLSSEVATAFACHGGHCRLPHGHVHQLHGVGEDVGRKRVLAWRQRGVELPGCAPVQLRRSAGSRAGAAGEPPVLNLEESIVCQAVKVEGGETTRDAHGCCGGVAADGITGGDDVIVERTPSRLAQRRQRLHGVWVELIVVAHADGTSPIANVSAYRGLPQ